MAQPPASRTEAEQRAVALRFAGFGADCGVRTRDILFTRQVLYQLS